MTQVEFEAVEPRARADAVGPTGSVTVGALELRELRRVADVDTAVRRVAALLRRTLRRRQLVVDLRVRGARRHGRATLAVAVLARTWGDDRAQMLDETLDDAAHALDELGVVRRCDAEEIDQWRMPLRRVSDAAWLTRAVLEDGLGGWSPRRLDARGSAEDRSVLWELLTSSTQATVLSVALRPREAPEALLDALEHEAGMRRELATPRPIGAGIYRAARTRPGAPAAGRVADGLDEVRVGIADGMFVARVLVAGEGKVGRAAGRLAALTGMDVPPRTGEELALAAEVLANVDTAHPANLGDRQLADVRFALAADEAAAVFRPPLWAWRRVPGLAMEELPQGGAAALTAGVEGDAAAAPDGRWLERLPEPLAAPLIRWVLAGDHHQRLEGLRWFFENLAAWRCIVLAAATPHDTLRSLRTSESRRVLRQPTFGVWTQLGRALAEHWRDRWSSEAFATDDPVLRDALLGGHLDDVLERARRLRNAQAHDAVDVVDALEALVADVHATWPAGLGRPRLLVSEFHRDQPTGAVTHAARVLDGSQFRFRREDVTLRMRVPTGRLFLHDEGRMDALELPPVILAHAPASSSYLLVEADGDRARFRRADARPEDTSPVRDDPDMLAWIDLVARR